MTKAPQAFLQRFSFALHLFHDIAQLVAQDLCFGAVAVPQAVGNPGLQFLFLLFQQKQNQYHFYL